MKEARFLYTSTCCGVQANKPACVKPKAQPKDAKRGKRKGRDEQGNKAPEFSTLGKWRCSSCGKPCKCSVNRRNDASQDVGSATGV